MKKLMLLLCTFMVTLAVPASASAYLHEANAISYVKNHVWVHFCNGYQNCFSYPWTVSTRRVSSADVRVRIGVGHRTYGNCYRTFEVYGSDSSMRITGGSDPYYSCPF